MERRNKGLSLTGMIGNNLTNDEEDVLQVKSELFKRGYYTKPVTNGIIDVETTNAIKNFQKDKGLRVDGVMKPGGETEQAIRMDLGYDNTERARRNQIINDADDFKFHIKSVPYYPDTTSYLGAQLHKMGGSFIQRNNKSQVRGLGNIVEEEANRVGLDANLAKSIMHIETTRGWYDELLNEADMNGSILPMNVRPDLWGDIGYSRKEMREDKRKNIAAGVRIIKGIQDRVPDKDIAKIGTLYQSLGAMAVSQYGEKVKEFYNEKPWLYEE
jgi:peptidoglycan hydrolase-like protein with peptidoglycan-binding domain